MKKFQVESHFSPHSELEKFDDLMWLLKIKRNLIKGLITALICIFICPTSVLAQYAKLLHKPHSEQKEILSDLYFSANQGGMTLDGLADTLAGMRQLGTEKKDPNLLQEADLLEAFYKVFNGLEPVEMLIQVQQDSEEKGFHTSPVEQQTELLRCIGNKWNMKNPSAGTSS